MKKTFISLILVAIMCLSFGAMFTQNEPIYADEDCIYIMTMGYGEVLTQADMMEMNFSVTTISDKLDNGYSEITQKMEEIKNAITQIDSQAKVNVCYTSSYPIFNGGVNQYKFHYNFVVTTNNIENKDKIISTISENGATSFQGCRLMLEDKQEIYNEALANAKADAEQKAKALYTDVTLKEMFEVSIYSFEHNGEIKVEACVKAKFQVNGNAQPSQLPEEDTTVPPQTQGDEPMPNDTPSQDNQTLSPSTLEKTEDDVESSSISKYQYV